MDKLSGSLAGILGFEKLSKYEKDYLHDANIRSCSYMGFIVVLLEVWMLIRQIYSKIIPKYQAGGDLFGLFVKYTSKYWLFLLIGLGLMLFCLFYQRDRKLSKGRFITLLVIGTACMLYTAVLSLEAFTKTSDTSLHWNMWRSSPSTWSALLSASSYPTATSGAARRSSAF